MIILYARNFFRLSFFFVDDFVFVLCLLDFQQRFLSLYYTPNVCVAMFFVNELNNSEKKRNIIIQ